MMKNVAVISIPSTKFACQIVYGQTLYRGADEFVDQVSRGVRSQLTTLGVGCGPVKRCFKPEGSAFAATTPSGVYFIAVCLEQKALPTTELVIWADARKDAAQSWSWFEPLFHKAIESECSGSAKWLTIGEYVSSEPSL